MASEGEGSVTIWIGDLKAGGDAAAQPLWERYFGHMVREARKVLRSKSHRGAIADEEDAVLSAFDSFCQGIKRDRFPRLADRDDLWRLLVVITKRKALDQLRYGTAEKRDDRRVMGEAVLLRADEAEGARGLDQVQGAHLLRGGEEVDAEPSPEFAAMLAEEYQRRLESLGDEVLRQVAIAKLEGYTDDEVATRLGYSRRYVQRKLVLIRQAWREERA
jgi:DNA-directed RNA polymerase specialized sigma24 family protein